MNRVGSFLFTLCLLIALLASGAHTEKTILPFRFGETEGIVTSPSDIQLFLSRNPAQPTLSQLCLGCLFSTHSIPLQPQRKLAIPGDPTSQKLATQHVLPLLSLFRSLSPQRAPPVP